MDFIDLKTQQKLIRNNIDERISNVLNHGQYIQGPEIKELENELSIFSKSKYVLCCSSGTDALLLGLIALGLKPGEAVIVPSFTFASTAEAVCMLGGIPFFSDVKLDTFNICFPTIITTKSPHFFVTPITLFTRLCKVFCFFCKAYTRHS